MDPRSSPTLLSCVLHHLERAIRLAVLPSLLLGIAPPASADTLFVTDIVDAIPAPPGSLRAAIEKSELNGEPDTIVFLIDGGTIQLVAPLPDLDEGHLSIGERRLSGPPTPGNAIAISGVNGVARAFRIRSEANLIADLDFVRFSGSEVILVTGDRAHDNTISGCVFGQDDVDVNAGAAIRITDPFFQGTPANNDIRFSRFVRSGTGIVIEGGGHTGSESASTVIHDNGFGTSPSGGPGPGTGEAIHAKGGRVLIQDNVFSGPGLGITLAGGSDGSIVAHNRMGLVSPDATTCSGFDDAAIRADGASRVEIRENEVSCSQVGLHLGPGAYDAEVRDNAIGGVSPAGHRSHGIVLDSSRGALIRGNRVSGNTGYGISATNSPAVIACNSIARNAAGALNLSDVRTSPPILTSATPVSVEGQLVEFSSGWVEAFGDDADQARVFQGALRVGNADTPFRHPLPVLGLLLGKRPEGTELDFEREIPPNHTATLTDEFSEETTELSDAIVASGGVVYDVIRGDLSNLASASSGGIDLGPVKCLASGLPPDPTAPNVVDPETPPEGAGFFYLIRRRGELANVLGTYDPAICLDVVDGFKGPRKPTSGDCS